MPQSTSATPTREIWLRVMQVQRFVSLNYSSVSHWQDRPETLLLMTKDTTADLLFTPRFSEVTNGKTKIDEPF